MEVINNKRDRRLIIYRIQFQKIKMMFKLMLMLIRSSQKSLKLTKILLLINLSKPMCRCLRLLYQTMLVTLKSHFRNHRMKGLEMCPLSPQPKGREAVVKWGSKGSAGSKDSGKINLSKKRKRKIWQYKTMSWSRWSPPPTLAQKVWKVNARKGETKIKIIWINYKLDQVQI